MANDASIYTRYFIWSNQQAEDKKKIEGSISSAKVQFPKVMDRGVYKSYTDCVVDYGAARGAYGDAKLICVKDIRTAVIKE